MSTYEDQQQGQQEQPGAGETSTDWMDDFVEQAFAGRPAPQAQPQGPYVADAPREVVPPEVSEELQTLREERYERDVAALVEEHPTFNDPAAANHLVEVAQQRAQEIGQPEAWRDTAFLRQVIRTEGGPEAFATSGRRVAESILQAAGKQPTDFRWW